MAHFAQQKRAKTATPSFQCAPDCPECTAVRQGLLGNRILQQGPFASATLVEAGSPLSLPLLLLYRDGLANLNGEACRLLSTQVAAVQLLAPTGPACPHWLLLAPPVGAVGRHTLYGRTDRAGSLRFRAPELAIALFAVLPAGQAALRLQLELAEPGSFQLIPVE